MASHLWQIFLCHGIFSGVTLEAPHHGAPGGGCAGCGPAGCGPSRRRGRRAARHGVPHGVAVGLMAPHVVAYNQEANAEWYDGLGAYQPETLAERLETLRAAAGMPSRLRECEVNGPDLDGLADLAAEEWTGKFNPRPVTRVDFRALYETAF